MSGWFAIKRGTLEHELFAPHGTFSRYEAWCWMIENAAFKASVIDLGGKPYTVPRGALCFSQRFLATKWGWSKKAVTTFLEKLEAHGAVALTVAETGTGTKSKRTQITLCNYEKYQSAGTKTEPRGGQEGAKEEQGNNIPVGEGADAPRDPASIIFTEGRKSLVRAGVDPKTAGKLLGKWRKDHGDEALIAALGRMDREGAIDPVSFMQGCFRFHRNTKSETRRIQEMWLA